MIATPGTIPTAGVRASPRQLQAEGERRKDQALQVLTARREVYVNRGRRALLTHGLEHGAATADDVRRVVNLPGGIDPVCLGAVPGALARAGIIRRAGFAKTTRPTAHARPRDGVELVDRDAAYRWLVAHPDAPDPAPGMFPGSVPEKDMKIGSAVDEPPQSGTLFEDTDPKERRPAAGTDRGGKGYV